MAKSKRINITIDNDLYEIIELQAKHKHISLSNMAKRLINKSLEAQEDYLLGKLAAKRMKEETEWVSHEEFWKDEL